MKRSKRKLIAVLLILALLIQPFQTCGLQRTVAKESEVTIETEKQEKPYIVREQNGLRSEYSKTFLLSDGSYQQVSYSEPIHYKKNGSFQNIDNRLHKEDQGFINKKRRIRHSFW